MESQPASLPASPNTSANVEAFKRAAWAYVDFDHKVNIGPSVTCALFSKVNAKAAKFNFRRKSPQDPRPRSCFREDDVSTLPGNSDSTSSTAPSAASVNVNPGELLLNKCQNFFDCNGLVAKVRKLPCEELNTSAVDGAKFPKYHFISRLRRHMFEHLMRSRTFLDTRYNSCNEMRNSKSPFSLFELNSSIVNRLQEFLDDLDDPDFTGLYISLSTKAYCTSSEHGTWKRSKVIAWAIVEIQASNERCLKCLWVHPNVCATSTTALLSAMLPYVIYVSFDYGPGISDARYPHKIFYVWLSDFDLFPRQALVLLASMDRFGLVKHYDYASAGGEHVEGNEASGGAVEGGGSADIGGGKVKAPPEPFHESMLPPEPLVTESSTSADVDVDVDAGKVNDTGTGNDNGSGADAGTGTTAPEATMATSVDNYNEAILSHTDAGIQGDVCHCMAGANWEEVDQVILACSHQLMQMLLPKWKKLVASGECSHLKRDIETLLLPQGSISRANRFVESYTEIRIAEFTGLEHLQVRDLMVFLYGTKWKYRLKIKTIKGPKSPPPLDYVLENCLFNFNSAPPIGDMQLTAPSMSLDRNAATSGNSAANTSGKRSTSSDDYDALNSDVLDPRLERRRRRHMEL